MLFKMALKNIRKSIKDYAIYFFTLIIGVAVFYIFNAIEDQTAYMGVTKDTRQMAKLLGDVLSGLSVFVAVVLGLLIVFASRFLMKRRNKEFATYILLGMSKKEISLIIFYETIIIGLVSLGVGLVIGLGLSQVMSVLVSNLFEADMRSFRFVISNGAIIKTVINFAIIYAIVIIFDTVMVGKTKLINLIQASKKSEKIRLKNPIVCVIVFILSGVALAYAYHTVISLGMEALGREGMIKFGMAICIGAVSTFFVFWSVSGLLLKVLMTFKRGYYKKLNSFTLRQLSSSVNTMVFAMTIICLLLFFTICGLSAAFTLRNSMNKTIKEVANADWEQKVWINSSVIEALNGDTDTIYDEDGEKYIDLSVIEAKSPIEVWQMAGDSSDEALNRAAEMMKEAHSLDVFDKYGEEYKKCFKKYVETTVYVSPGFYTAKALGKAYDELINNYGEVTEYDKNLDYIVRLSDYNDLADLRGWDKIELAEDEYAVGANFRVMVEYRNKALKNGEVIDIYGRKLKPARNKVIEAGLDIASSREDEGFFIVPDSVIDNMGDKSIICQKSFMGNYDLSNNVTAEQMDEKLTEMVFSCKTEDTDFITYGHMTVSKHSLIKSSIGFTTIATFLFLYLGIVFLITSAVILALKALSDSADSMERYDMLRKIGVEEKDINGSLFRQQGIFFILPMILALIHSIFGIKFINKALIIFTDTHILSAIIATSLIIIAIYGGYFIITYLYSKQIIKGKTK